MSSNVQKLRILRARTDRDLLILLQRELDRALVIVDSANPKSSPLFTQAAKTFATARVLVGTISGLSHGDWRRIGKKLDSLRSRLDQVSAYEKAWRYAVSFAQ